MKENVVQINDGINGKCRCECKKRQVCEKDYMWNPATCSCEKRKYLSSILMISNYL